MEIIFSYDFCSIAYEGKRIYVGNSFHISEDDSVLCEVAKRFGVSVHLIVRTLESMKFWVKELKKD